MNKTDFLANLHEVGLNDLDMVGGKNASLGEMLQNLTKLGINIPGGFIITVDAYRTFIRKITWMKRFKPLSMGLILMILNH